MTCHIEHPPGIGTTITTGLVPGKLARKKKKALMQRKQANDRGMGAKMRKSSGNTDASRLLEFSTDASQLLHDLSSINNGTPSPVPAPSAAMYTHCSCAYTHSLTATLVLGYGCLIAVNMASGLGVFGPSNAVTSNAYPTAITPSGYALRQPQNGFVAGLHFC
jgi:hypothetical protein